MRQLHVTHPTGFFATCSACAREPKHIVSFGTTSREPLLTIALPDGQRHHLECNPCGRRTAKQPSIDAAYAEWNTAFATPVRREITHRRAPAFLTVIGERTCTR